LAHYDGYGELRLPNGDTLKKISRLKIVDTLNTTVQLFGAVQLIREQYEYYNLDSMGAMPLMITSHSYVLSSFPDPLVDIKMILSSRQPLLMVGLKEKSDLEEKLKIFPNPSSGTVHILGMNEKLNFELYTTIGQLVLSGKVEETNQWSLSPGVYQLVLKSGRERILKKIVIQ
jgi:hypothetical protein